MRLSWNNPRSIFIAVFLLFLATYYWSGISSALGNVVSAFVPVIIGACIAYVINILMSFYERHFLPKATNKRFLKWRRPLCVLAAVITVAAVVSAVIALVVPQFISCLNILSAQAPAIIDKSLQNPYIASAATAMGIDLTAINWDEWVEWAGNFLLTGLSRDASAIASSLTSLASAIASTAFGLVFAMYMLSGKEKISVKLDKFIKRTISQKWVDRLHYCIRTFDNSFHNYIVSQCLEASILGVLCMVGMLLIGLPYAPMVSALVGLTALIPMVGAYIGAIVGAFMMLSVSPGTALLFLIYLVVLQQIEGNLIYPYVVGNFISTPGIIVLAGVTVGGSLAGILGTIVGVPIAAALYKMLNDLLKSPEQPGQFKLGDSRDERA